MGKGGERPAPLVLPAESKELLSGPSYAATKLAAEDAWIDRVDLDAFQRECAAIGKELAASQGPADVAHLRKIIWWSRACQWAGLGLALAASRLTSFTALWAAAVPAAVFCLSLGTLTRWTIVGHHVCHGGFDKCSKQQYSRFRFGVGSLYRRAVDWLDWMLVEAWNVEHNQLHHYHLGEIHDPDLVEFNMEYLRGLEAPKAVKYVAVFLIACTWKWWYYAPNTYKRLRVNERRKKGLPELEDTHRPQTFDFAWLVGSGDATFFKGYDFLMESLAPYFVQRFVVLPLPFLWLGGYATVLACLVGAEVLTNMHAFLVIATNHAGDDLYRFERHCKPRSGTFYLRQVISSANFATGSDLNDFLHGWLNYQIEHHLWPDLSMLSYQKAQPLIEALCAKHGIPYVQENVFWRLKKLVDIMVGDATMRKFPTKFEYAADLGADDLAGSD